jgi:CheY-like chemotaxis protein
MPIAAEVLPGVRGALDDKPSGLQCLQAERNASGPSSVGTGLHGELSARVIAGPPGRSSVSLCRPRALVIDDEARVRAFVGDAVDSLGYSVDEAEDGAQGLMLLDQHRYELLITDLRMPQMSGWEIIEALARQRRLPIIIMSGFITPADEARAREAGLAILRKPFGVAELKRAIRESLAAERADVPRKPLAKGGESDSPEADAQEPPAY